MIHDSDISTPSYTYKVQVCNDLVTPLANAGWNSTGK
jgi:hypothetical protein